MADDRFKHESLQDTETIMAYLDAISRGFADGALTLGSRERRLVFHPKGLVSLKVDAARRDDEVKLNIKIRWSEKPVNGEEGEPPLVIKAGAADPADS